MSVQHDSMTQVDDSHVSQAEAPAFDTMGSTTVKRVAPKHPETREPVLQGDVRRHRASIGLILGGFAALLLSAWAGLVPLIGPTFGFSADGTSSWKWNEVHVLGAIVPGALGLIACVVVLTRARRPMGFLSVGTLTMAGFALFLCGAWLTIVPIIWPVIVGSYFHSASASRVFEYWLGYASGPGILLASFGGYVIGRARREARSSLRSTR